MSTKAEVTKAWQYATPTVRAAFIKSAVEAAVAYGNSVGDPDLSVETYRRATRVVVDDYLNWPQSEDGREIVASVVESTTRMLTLLPRCMTTDELWNCACAAMLIIYGDFSAWLEPVDGDDLTQVTA